jgi:hypothetical protein
MEAELEYIRTWQNGSTALECLPCKSGQSQPGSSRCSICEPNMYLDTDSKKCE